MMTHNRAIKKLKTIYTAMTVSVPMDNRKTTEAISYINLYNSEPTLRIK